MRRRFALLPLALAALVAACEEETLSLDEGTPSTLDVRAYVDADGDGAFTAANDVAITGATVTLAGDDGQLTAATGADGLATFGELPPGSYQATLSGTIPPGAVLSTATTLTVAAPFQGDDLEAEFRFAFLPGTVSGVVFRDDNMSGDFEPAEDTPAAGLPVVLLEGTGTAGDTVATGVTDALGTFVFDGIRPGDYTIVITPFESIDIVGGNEIPVTVGADGVAGNLILFTGDLVIPVADARDAQGSIVTVEGVVTYAPDFSTSGVFFQDATGGMGLFDSNLVDQAGRALAVGDSIRVTGTSGSFRSEVQISPVTAIEILATVSEPDPRPVTAAAINAGTFAGELVTIDGTVVDVEVLSFGNQRVLLEDAVADTFAVFADSRTGVTEDAWEVGQTYAVTGVLGTDDRDALQERIEPRQPSDVVELGPVIDIADARTMPGATVRVEGVVTWAPSFDTRVIFFQDGTGGVSVFDSNLDDLAGAAPQMGDRVRIRGVVGAFAGELQLGSLGSAAILGNEAVPAPRLVTADEINAGMFQGELVTVEGATVTAVENPSFDNQLVTLTDGNGDSFSVFGDDRTGVSLADWTVGEVYTVIGVLGTDTNQTLPERIEVRQPSDVNQTS
jgi:hypothetical protein